MKAIVIREPGGPEVLSLEEVPEPRLGEGQIAIDVRATALNRADLLQRRGLYPPPKGESEILGLECAGVVAAHGPGASGPPLGSRVMALLPGGGYAERVVVPERMALPIPEGLSFEQAAAIPEAFLTAQEALFTLGRVAPGDTVLVHAAAGGVGSAAVQLAHEHGARVIATAGSDEKLERVRALGADVAVNYKTADFAEAVRSASDGRGADVVLDFVGGAYWEKHASCLAVGGRVVVIGVLGGPMAEVNLAQLLMRRYQILGLVMRSRPLADKIAISQTFARNWLPRFATGKLAPVVDCVLPLSEARRAHERMEENANVGKIVLTLSP
ncbi:MAG: NAD(P)H-quinone oxidoreductase [Myxococcales bacterium]|nr:NAD(P)H-quinone oxidoreductase [Myxococcales bacterium]